MSDSDEMTKFWHMVADYMYENNIQPDLGTRMLYSAYIAARALRDNPEEFTDYDRELH